MVSSRLEPEWDDESRDLVVAYDIVRNLTGRYGEWLPDATNPGASPTDYATGLRYVVDPPETNWAEKAALDAEAEWRKKQGKDANSHGMYWPVRLIEFEPTVEP